MSKPNFGVTRTITADVVKFKESRTIDKEDLPFYDEEGV